MKILLVIWLILHAIPVFWLVFHALGVFFSSLKKEPHIPEAAPEADFACVITAYKNMDIAVPLVESLLKQQYPHFHIYLVGDQCEGEFPISHENLTVHQPAAPLNSKVRSMRYGVEQTQRAHSHAVIFDPDNLAPTHFLKRLNDYLVSGYPAVQGLRVAKNLDSTIACIDAAGEYYYNYTTRYVPWRLGSSTNIAGSGQAVRMDLFKAYLDTEEMDIDKHGVIAAEDKILQHQLVGQGYRIGCAHDARLYDEKISEGGQLERQRTRWLHAYFRHLPQALGVALKGLAKLDVNRFLSGLYAAYPPMFLLVSGSIILGGIDLVGWLFFGASPWAWGAVALVLAVVIFGLNFMLALKLGGAPASVFKAMLKVPVFVWRQFKALFQMGKAKKDFLVTTNQKVMRLEDVEKK
ncbi:MAG: glycosyltransferase [Bacteroidia bacterium]